MALPLLPILLVGGIALVAMRKKSRPVGGSFWQPSQVSGLEVYAPPGMPGCSKVRLLAANVPTFEAWSLQNQDFSNRLDALVVGGHVKQAAEEFVAALGCMSFSEDTVIISPDGSTITIRQFIDALSGAALAPDARFFQLLRL